jgi:hypothetical protein
MTEKEQKQPQGPTPPANEPSGQQQAQSSTPPANEQDEQQQYLAQNAEEEKEIDKEGRDWTEAGKKLEVMKAKKEKDGHYFNTYTKPLIERFVAGERSKHLYNQIASLK